MTQHARRHTSQPTAATGDRLADALARSRDAASEGYELARQHALDTREIIATSTSEVKALLGTIEQGRTHQPEVKQRLGAQLRELTAQLAGDQRAADEDLAASHRDLEHFTVAVFGRTTVGKSTLAEILIGGDGASIGRGAQRTTRSVRTYAWRGLRVLDVPGVAAFEGHADEELAMEAARRADLVVFLVNDNHPQPVEAQWLARLRTCGKPVVGLMNVRFALAEPDDTELFLHRLPGVFDRKRLDALVDQFHQFVEIHTPADRVPFVFTHLHARYLSTRPEFAPFSDTLRRASRFDDFIEQVTRIVVDRGPFFRSKTFADAAASRLLTVSATVLEHARLNELQVRTLAEKRRKLESWRHRFVQEGQRRVTTDLGQRIGRLRGLVPSFAEQHCEDPQAGRAWQQTLAAEGLERGVQGLQRQLEGECLAEVSAFTDELKVELDQVVGIAVKADLGMRKLVDSRLLWKMGVGAASMGLAIGGLFFPPLLLVSGLVALVGGLLSFLFNRRGERRRQAAQRLEQTLYHQLAQLEENLGVRLKVWVSRGLGGSTVDPLLGKLQSILAALESLAATQRKLGLALVERQRQLAWLVFERAVAHARHGEVPRSIRKIARVPGHGVWLLVKPGAELAEALKRDLRKLLGEPVQLVLDVSPEHVLRKLCLAASVRVDGGRRSAALHVSKESARHPHQVQAAQQLTGLHVFVA